MDNNLIPIEKFQLDLILPCNSYITSVDIINNIVAVTDTSNIVYFFDMYKRKQVLKLEVWNNVSISEVKLLKKYKTDNENSYSNENEEDNGNFEIKEFLLIEYGQNKKRININHCTLYNSKTIHKYMFSHGINENGFALHPKTHIFIVALENKELGVYRITDKTCLYSTQVQNQYCIPCFDKNGIVYACSAEKNFLYLYSSYADEYTEEYFAKFDISAVLENEKDYCTHMDFSYDDKKIIIVTKCCRIFTIDAFHGTILYNYKYKYNEKQILPVNPVKSRPIFSFDSNFIMSGDDSNNVCVWDMKGNHICELPCNGQVAFIKWIYNRYAFITTTTSVMMWKLS